MYLFICKYTLLKWFQNTKLCSIVIIVSEKHILQVKIFLSLMTYVILIKLVNNAYNFRKNECPCHIIITVSLIHSKELFSLKARISNFLFLTA